MLTGRRLRVPQLIVLALTLLVVGYTGAGARLRPPSGVCKTVSDCYGLGDCVDGRCHCDPWASAAADCSALAVLPVD
eukprot:COSAG02_NODE_381_length_23450_cov_65.782493_1_plen_77_part_00